MIYEIKSRLDGQVIYSVESDSLLKAVELAVKNGANLDGANLDGANLDGANLDGANRLDTGETWEEYLGTVVPELLRAGGKSLESFVNHWQCHSWDNCPMAYAFSCKSEDETPLLLRPRVRQFVRLFDAKLIPVSVLESK